MRVAVDQERCDLHGQCVFAAPEIFSFNEGDELVYLEEPPAELEAKARAAASVCPTGAISVGE
jgi:ferredoxin